MSRCFIESEITTTFTQSIQARKEQTKPNKAEQNKTARTTDRCRNHFSRQ